MRVLMTTTGFPGHVLPLVPFARACRSAGHEVCVAGPRSAAPLLEDLGLPFCGWADPPREQLEATVAAAAELGPAEGHALMIAEAFGRIATRAVLPEALRLVGAWWPDVVVRESQDFAGRLAAAHHGVPHVRVALGLAASEQETIALAAAPLRDVRAELDLAGGGEDEPCLTLVPSALDGPTPSPVHRFRGHRTPARPLPDWWPGATGPLVYVTFGSVAARLGYFPELYRAVCLALAELPVRVLVTVGGDGDPAALGRLPDNVRAESWVAQERVLPHAAAVVCHGGYGSVLGALTLGVPLVLLPLFAGDQRPNAQRVAELGAGVVLEEPRRTMFAHPGDGVLAALPDAVRGVLERPGFRAAARRVADEVAALPPVDRAVDVITHTRRTS